FFMHALPDFFNVANAAREGEALLKQGFKGIKVCGGHLAQQKVALDDERLMPLWSRMAREGHVLAVDLGEGALQVPALEHILKLNHELKVAIGHFGMVTRGDWLSQIHLAKHKHVYIETGGIVWLFRKEGYPFKGAITAIQQAKRE